MALLSTHCFAPQQLKLRGNHSNTIFIRSSPRPYYNGKRVSRVSVEVPRSSQIRAFFINPTDEPLVKEALKEPVAFLGGVFAGLLRLDLKEDPLREWVARTAEAAGLDKEQQDGEPQSQGGDEAPQQIEIE